jgi:stage III sporulation protein AF
MMEWLSDWLKQVILIILLAAFVDLLLPNQTMQRYVKTVVSLFILMTLLTPVFELFQRGWDAEKLLAEAERLQTESTLMASAGGSGRNTAGKLKTLEGILADSEKLKTENGQEARKLAERRLADEMKAGLEKATGARVEVLEASIETDNQGNPAIGKVRAVLLHKQEPEQASSAGRETTPIGRIRIEEVKPVMIQIQPASPASKETMAEEEDSLQEEMRTASIRYFKQEWQLSQEHLEIRIYPGQRQ